MATGKAWKKEINKMTKDRVDANQDDKVVLFDSESGRSFFIKERK